ncbi:purine catabolism regulatory family protein [Glaciihabitans tibetensis]|uniref:Purine catabolism regulatory family protein n=1 Tax=Glaciihabitans tibetensis TaxID=1266600 RepID=A0A2T0VF79_9MICO|nr:PucR family transcriptional regulator [Glaciihabitans tibetensis]PRY68812.1 purine catabolism regulatory family protein [Glaciihabitans tibetensis]
MIFGDLVHRTELGISVLAAADNALDRQITGVYITDLPDPSRFISSGDVVLTSGLWAQRPGGIDTFVDALARQKVAALIVGRIELGHIPDAVIAACRARHLTLATISERVSFKTLSEEVDRGQPDSTSGILARGVRFNHQLTEVLSHGGGALAALQLFRDEFSVGGWLMDDVGTVVAAAGTQPSHSHVGKVWNAMVGRTSDGVSLVPDAEDRPFSVWPVGATQQGGAAGYLVCWGDHRTFSPEISIVLDGLLGALRIELELSARWRNAQHNHVAELVQVLVDDAVSPGEISARLRLEGIDPQLPTSVVVATVEDRDFPLTAVLEMAYRLFASENQRVVGCVIDRQAILLVSNPETDVTLLQESVIRAADDYLPLLNGRQLRLGVSDPTPGVSQLSSSVAVARDRLAGVSGDGPVEMVSASAMQSHRALLRMLGERTRSSFAAEVLRPLIAYDNKNGGDLLGTLRAFLGNGGAWMETARQLHLHANTLRYRIGRIEELTDRDLGTMSDRVDLFLALACTDNPE